MVDSVQSNPLPLILKLPPNVVYYGILGICSGGRGGFRRSNIKGKGISLGLPALLSPLVNPY